MSSLGRSLPPRAVVSPTSKGAAGDGGVTTYRGSPEAKRPATQGAVSVASRRLWPSEEEVKTPSSDAARRRDSDAGAGLRGGPSFQVTAEEWMSPAMEPVVRIPVDTKPGETPRRVVVERLRREFAELPLHDVLADQGLQFEAAGVEQSPDGVALPLHLFDNTDHEVLAPSEWIARGRAPPCLGTPGRVLLPQDDGVASHWVRCHAVDYDPDTERFTVTLDGSMARPISTPRLYLCFLAEDPQAYVDRVSQAVEARRMALQRMRYSLVLDSMPTDGLPRVDAEAVNRVLNAVTSSGALRAASCNTADLVREMDLDFVRTMSFLLLRRLAQHSEDTMEPGFPEAVQHIRDGVRAADAPPTAQRRPGDLPEYNFAERFSDFSFASMLTAEEVIKFLDGVRTECCVLRGDGRSMFRMPPKAVRAEEFLNAQRQARGDLSNFLHEVWPTTVRQRAVAAFQGMSKGWFNLEESRVELHRLGKLHKLFRLVNFAMQDALQQYTRAELRRFRDFVHASASHDVDVRGLKDVRVREPVGAVPGLASGQPLFHTSLLVAGKGATAAFALDTDPDVLADALPDAVVESVRATAGVQQVEFQVMTKLFWSETPHICPVSDMDPEVLDASRALREYMEKVAAPLHAYAKLFDPYLHLLRLDVDVYVQDLTKQFQEEPLDMLDDVLRLIKKHEQDAAAAARDIPDSVLLGAIALNLTSARHQVVTKHRAIVSKLEDALQSHTAAVAKAINDGFRAVDHTLNGQPADIEGVAELREQMKAIPNTTRELKARTVNVVRNYEALEKRRYHVPGPEFAMRWRIVGWPRKLHDKSLALEEELGRLKVQFHQEFTESVQEFEQHLDEIDTEVTSLRKFTDIAKVHMASNLVGKIAERLTQADESARLFNSREAILGVEISTFGELSEVHKKFEPFSLMWATTRQWLDSLESWQNGAFTALDPEEVEKTVTTSFRNLNKASKALERMELDDCAAIAVNIRANVEEFKPFLPLIHALRNPGMKERHWQDLGAAIGKDLDPTDAGFTLKAVEEMGLVDYSEKCTKVGETAGKEFQIEQALNKMEKEWEGVDLEISPYRETGTYVLHGVEEIMALLDEHITMTQAMSFSAFKKHFEERIETWGTALATMSEVIDAWVQVQRSWMYLQPIFDSPDINKQLPAEGKRFSSVDKTWRSTLASAYKLPRAVKFCSNQRLLDRFNECNKLLDLVQKGLAEYLETKRAAFSRFYFLSNDELLEILSQTKDPTRVQPHLKKCFEAIKAVDFQKGNSITAMNSSEGEHVSFLSAIKTKSRNVEEWMNDVEFQMRQSVKSVMCDAVADYRETKRTDWIQRWPGMCVLNGSQVHWTMEVEDALNTRGNDGIRDYYDQQVAQLNDMVELVRGELSKMARTTVGALAVIDVHARDVTKKMVEDGVSSTNDFLWLSQLRYYWDGDAMDGDLWTMMVTSKRPYGYEYLGNSFRLVITPLTDKCYLTLMGALQMVLGGAPAGPAGTGKTETTKDLAKALAKQCVVFNCSDGMDYKMTGKFFKGLASCGAWACFDEFNRITVEVLSVIAQQIMTLQRGVVEGKTRIHFEETDINLSAQFAVFITMNPGYAGRTELPDNLKALFRPVAMMVPDYALIGEIMLFSFGFANARLCARKMVATFRLCSEQLSSQDHYDYGMRAVKTVIVAAGNLKRAEPEMDEEVLLLRALIDVNLPKFLAHDLPLFRGIMSDLFPGKAKPAIDYGELLRCIKLCAQKRNLQAVPFFLEKCIQLYEMIVVRHGLMVVGPTGGAKSSNIFVLRDALTMLAEKGIEGERFEKVQVHYLNPKSITMGQLYGEIDPNTQEWQDGVIANLIRECAKAGTPTLKWMLFDGPVDTLWIESMNTVLDDNKKLCLNSGEIVALSNEMTMMFEPADLAVASPATVSRCGMVYMEPRSLGLDCVVQSWMESLPPACGPEHRQRLFYLIDSFLQPALTYLRRNMYEPLPTVDNNLVSSMLNIMDCFLEPFVLREDRDPPSEAQCDALLLALDGLFFFALTWSAGATSTRQGRRSFDQYVRALASLLSVDGALPPASGLLHDFQFDLQENTWVPWMELAEPFKWSADMEFNEILVPTVDTVRYTWLLDLLIRNRKHVLMTGDTGTGKTANINKHLQGGMPDNYVPLTFTFSAQTSANQTQDIIDGKTEKRRKGVFGPPVGKRFIIFVDDVNMPQREIFFAQPPVELLRQLMCAGGWYDRKTLTWRNIVDSTLVLACGPPGGGRNPVTPRFFRHFNIIGYTAMQDESMFHIYHSILSNFLVTFADEVQELSSGIVWASIHLFNTITEQLLPTPAKPHYTFNMRDVGKVFQGLMMADSRKVQVGRDFVRLWVHEVRRVFRDRMINNTDSEWFDSRLDDYARQDVNTTLKDVLGDDPRILFGDYLDIAAEPRVYEEIKDIDGVVNLVTEYLGEFNADTKSPMPLVLFMDAVEHVSRIARVVRQPYGNALLLGVGGSGRQSLSKLATYMCSFELFQVEIAKGYGKTEWREDLKRCLLGAGLKEQPTVFLFNDTQIVFEGMVEDINNVLNTGDVPNLYAPEEMDEIMSTCRVDCQKRQITPTKLNIFAQFINRIRRNIHVVLCMSPLGESFRRRLRMFPSLVNCCTIDWFREWPDEALRNVAHSSMTSEDLKLGEHLHATVDFFRLIHQSVARQSDRYLAELRRHNYVTPTSYLELLGTYKAVLLERRKHVGGLRDRLQKGLDKLETTQTQVAELQEQIKEMQPKLVQKQKEVGEMMVQISADKEEAAKTKEAVAAEEAEANAKAKEANTIKEDAQRDLAEALPALDAAVKSLKNLKKSDLDEVKALGKPPAGVKMTMEATCILFAVKPARVADPNTPGKKIMDYWDPAKKTLLANANKLLKDLMEFDKDNIPESIITKLEPFISNPEFTPAKIEKASKACTAICMWVHAMYKYHCVAKEVEPKRQALKAAEEELEVTLKQLEKAKKVLAEVEERLASLESKFEAAEKEKQELVDTMELCKGRLERAESLLGGLGGEQVRWQATVKTLNAAFDNLVGDSLISSGAIAYIGAFTPEYRQSLMLHWRERLQEIGVPHTVNCSITSVLADPVAVRAWTIAGLPTDNHSVENGIIMDKARRWPLLIDPQGQANRYIKNMGKDAENGMDVIKLSDKNFLRTLENGVRFGKWVLLENIAESLDAALEPLLLQQKFKQGGTEMIKVGDSTIPYNDQFRFFITTKLPNPHYPPEVCVKVSLLNFTITPSGLEDQLLGVAVVEEMPELEERKNTLVVSNAKMRRQLEEIENKILQLLSNSTGNILDDVELIKTLADSKETSAEINLKVAEAEETEKEIDESREDYRPVAFRGSILYFCIAQLATVDPMYQYSLQWYTALFTQCIRTAEAAEDVAQRIKILKSHFTLTLYTNVCRSLFERHKLLFSFLVAAEVMRGDKTMDEAAWQFLISGQSGGAAAEEPNPCTEWLTDRAWAELQALSTLEACAELADSVAPNEAAWREYFDAADTHRRVIPAGWDTRLKPLHRLCVLRCFRPDTVVESIQDFVAQGMGQEFVEPPPFDLGTSFYNSSTTSPMIFVLSAGTDPTKIFLDFAAKEGMENKVRSLSLGQGQNVLAEAMIKEGLQRGLWVYLQNCHLYTSWMPKLEEVVETIDPDMAHKDFRLWLTSMPSIHFPPAVLQNGVKMTMEPPKGLRANLKNAYFKLNDEMLIRTSKPREYQKLLFALSFFHAVVQDRRKFGPLGWNIPYEFNESDLEISRRQLELFLDKYEDVPYRVLNILTSYINYGGRVTDYIDLRTIDIILRELFCADVMLDDYKFSSSGMYYSCPVDPEKPHARYMEYIESLPINPDPEVFGMHANANISCAQAETYAMFDTILTLQAGGDGGSGKSRDNIIDEVCTSILDRLPPVFDTETIGLLYPLKYEESMNTVLLQECIRYNGVVAEMHRTLPELRKALKGLVVMSGELESMAEAVFTQRIPDMWESKAYPCLKPLQSWVQELMDRLSFLQRWIDDGIPAAFWISGFFFPQAFLTGTLQNYARKHQLPIDTVSFSFNMMLEDWRDIKDGPEDGVYIYGLFLEGARWNKEIKSLDDSIPKQLYSEMPTIHLVPEEDRKAVESGIYRCPVYKVLTRRGTLSTTGHSTNFVMWLEVPSNRSDIRNNLGMADQDTWIKAGVAAFCSLQY